MFGQVADSACTASCMFLLCHHCQGTSLIWQRSELQQSPAYLEHTLAVSAQLLVDMG